MDMDMLEYNYASGRTPERYYNQLNKKSGQENYRRLSLKRKKKKKYFSLLESFVLSVLRTSLQKTLNELLDEIIKTK